MSRTYKHIALNPNGSVDRDNTTVICEAPGCGNEVKIGESYSFVVVFATTGPRPIASFQCEEEQHFACSYICARNAAIECIDNHLIPSHKELESEIISDMTTTVTELP